MQFMQITILNLENFLLAAGSKACFANKIFALVKILINLAPEINDKEVSNNIYTLLKEYRHYCNKIK